VLTTFSSKRKSLAQLLLQISSSISLAVCSQQSYLRPSRNRQQLRCCGIQSVFCYSIYGIVPSNNRDPPNNGQVNASDWLFNSTSASHNNPVCSNFDNPITCWYFNAQSLVNKLSKFQSLIYSFNYDTVLFLKRHYMIQFMTRKSYLPTTVFFTKTDTPVGVESWLLFEIQFLLQLSMYLQLLSLTQSRLYQSI